MMVLFAQTGVSHGAEGQFLDEFRGKPWGVEKLNEVGKPL